jgi:hypothetical protein
MPRKNENTAVGIHCADQATLYPENLALTSPTSGDRSVVIVLSRTNSTEFLYPHTRPRSVIIYQATWTWKQYVHSKLLHRPDKTTECRNLEVRNMNPSTQPRETEIFYITLVSPMFVREYIARNFAQRTGVCCFRVLAQFPPKGTGNCQEHRRALQSIRQNEVTRTDWNRKALEDAGSVVSELRGSVIVSPQTDKLNSLHVLLLLYVEL